MYHSVYYNVVEFEYFIIYLESRVYVVRRGGQRMSKESARARADWSALERVSGKRDVTDTARPGPTVLHMAGNITVLFLSTLFGDNCSISTGCIAADPLQSMKLVIKLLETVFWRN